MEYAGRKKPEIRELGHNPYLHISFFPMSPANCLNCGTTIQPAQNFCPQCGQKTGTHRISLHEITHDAVHYFTHADKGIFHLLKALATRPGKVAQEYIDGRRKTYFKPLNFFLIVAGIVVFMTSALSKEYPQPKNNRPPNASVKPMSPEQIAKYRAMGVRANKVRNITDKYSNVISMLATPLLTIFFWLCYKRNRFSYLEHLVANMYFVPFTMLFFALVFVPLQRMVNNYSFYMGVMLVFFVFEIVYRGIAYYQFMGKKGGRYMFKAIGVSFLATGLWIVLTYSLISYYIWNGF